MESPKILKQQETELTVASWNICSAYSDRRSDLGESTIHNWCNRKSLVINTILCINADIIGLQEVLPTQGWDLYQALAKTYQFFFLFQNASFDVRMPGIIVQNEQIRDYITFGNRSLYWNKKVGTPCIVFLIRRVNTSCSNPFFKASSLNVIQFDRFWLKDDPDALPYHFNDKGVNDKGFGNHYNYRAVLWLKLVIPFVNESETIQKSLYIFNSHYPLDGDSLTRYRCAEVERLKIDAIAGSNWWISFGDRNNFLKNSEKSNPNGTFLKDSDPYVLKPLLDRGGFDSNQASIGKHFGPLTTWSGLSFHKCVNPIINGSFSSSIRIDYIISNRESICSFHFVGTSQNGTFSGCHSSLEVLCKLDSENLKSDRLFASDHLFVVTKYNV